jgi:hypothetical protein
MTLFSRLAARTFPSFFIHGESQPVPVENQNVLHSEQFLN